MRNLLFIILFWNLISLAACIEKQDDNQEILYAHDSDQFTFQPPPYALDVDNKTESFDVQSVSPELEKVRDLATDTSAKKIQPSTKHSMVSRLGFQPRVYNPTYTPLCNELLPNTTYTLSGTTVGQQICFYFEVTNTPATVSALPVKIRGSIFNQLANNDHYLRVLQDDPQNPGSFPLAFHNPITGNDDERVTFLSDEGHYYLLIEAIETTGADFDLRLDAVWNYDAQELAESTANPFELVVEEEIIGNIDSNFDVDVYAYETIGTDIHILLSSDLDAHDVIYSPNGGVDWFNLAPGHWTLNSTPGDQLLFGVLPGPTPDPSATYSLAVYDDRGIDIHSLVGEIVNSQENNTARTNHYQNIPGYTVSGYPIRGGVFGHFVRFFGQLKIASPEGLKPAAYRSFTFDWTQTDNNIGGVYHEQEFTTDENGFYEIIIGLDECKGSRTYTKTVSGLDPDLWFSFDQETYHINVETSVGTKLLNTANEYFFNLCNVREDDQNGRSLNPFTYD